VCGSGRVRPDPLAGHPLQSGAGRERERGNRVGLDPVPRDPARIPLSQERESTWVTSAWRHGGGPHVTCCEREWECGCDRVWVHMGSLVLLLFHFCFIRELLHKRPSLPPKLRELRNKGDWLRVKGAELLVNCKNSPVGLVHLQPTGLRCFRVTKIQQKIVKNPQKSP
jgi:hypothetical protein